jgi:hypothetical protein
MKRFRYREEDYEEAFREFYGIIMERYYEYEQRRNACRGCRDNPTEEEMREVRIDGSGLLNPNPCAGCKIGYNGIGYDN